MTSFIVRGSHGDMTVHASTGVIVDRPSCDCGDCHGGYRNIARFDPADIAREGGDETDILALGYWTTDHVYVEPLVQRLHELPDRQMFFDDWVPLRLLEGPNHG